MKNYITKKEKEEILNLTKKLISIPSSKNDNNEIYEFIFDYLKKKGLDPEIQKITNPFMPLNNLNNVYIKISNGKGPKVMINGHLDTVTLSENWFKSPYEAYEEDEKIYGLGAADMKGGCASGIIAFLNFIRNFPDFKGELFLSLVFGEEDSFSFGTDTLLREYDLKNYDLIIIPEPSPVLADNNYCFTHKKIHKAKFPAVIIGAEGRALFTIEFFGKNAHASQPKNGINAIQDAAEFIHALSGYDYFSNIKMGRGEYCVLNFEGEAKGFSIPGYCKIQVNRHLVIGETWKTAMKELKKIITSLKIKSKIKITKNFSPNMDFEYCPYIYEESEIINDFIDKIPPIYKNKTCRFTTRSVGDFNFFAKRTKVPTLVFGPGGGNIHSANEFVYKEDLFNTAEYIISYLYDIYKK